MRHPASLLVLAAAIACLAPSVVHAEILPEANPYGDAADVDLIVEGQVVGDDRVAVARVLFASGPFGPDVREIKVPGLSKHDMLIRDGDIREGERLEAVGVVLLLDRTAEASTWRPHHLILEDAERGGRRGFGGGAAGTFWLRDDQVFGYAQQIRPGPLMLMRWPSHTKETGTPEMLRKEIAAGVAARRAWEADLAVADPAQRARQLVRWLQPASSPDGERRTRRRYAVREEMRKIGSAAVPALVNALGSSNDEEAREQALLSIADLGPAAQEAVPSLLQIASDPGRLPRGYVAAALRHAGDARAIPSLREILAAADLADTEALRHAAGGLVELNDAEAAARIAAKLPESIDGLKSPYGVLELLDALDGVDPARVHTWLAPRATDSLFTHSKERVRRLLDPAARHVDLASLAARIRPKEQGGDWKSVFEDLIALRDRPVADAVPLLAQVMRHERGSSRIFRYAAAQALHAVGTVEALQVLDEEAAQADFDGRLAFDYAFHWNMAPALRDGFLERYVLRNAGEAPSLVLRIPTGTTMDPPRLEFDIDVRNDLQHPLEIMDPRDRNGEMLVFRQIGGHFVRTQWPGTCEHMGARSMTLGPGASRFARVTVDLVRPESLPGVQQGWAPPNGVAGHSGGYVFLLGTPGDYEVVARWTSARGRSVSQPVRVHVRGGE